MNKFVSMVILLAILGAAVYYALGLSRDRSLPLNSTIKKIENDLKKRLPE
jgi:hypothetical protein